MATKIRCPRCKRMVYNEACVRQGDVKGLHIIDVGYRCSKCGHEWGFAQFNKKRSKKLKRVM